MAQVILGIDLGTTNSCVAAANDHGEVAMVPNQSGEFSIPSIYAITARGDELVGNDAKRQWQLNPTQTVFGSKRLLGTRFDSDLLPKMRAHVHYPVERGDHGEIIIPIGGKKLRPVDVAAKILAKLRDMASVFFKTPLTRAVVTCPAYFNEIQRQAVHEAGRLAGLEVVRIINEPTAAAIAYSARRHLEQKVAIYDLGGGTFDLSIIAIRGRTLEVLATGGDVFLGGIDFDDAIVEYVVTDFKAGHGLDLSPDPVAMQRVRDMAERVKIDLSARLEAPLSIPFITKGLDGNPVNLSMVIRRDELEMLVQPLIDKTFDVCAKVIGDADLTADQIDAVVLNGGQTRMPIIGARIEQFFGKPPVKTVNPDEAVARGAALLAWSFTDNSDLKFQLLDVLPMAISIQTAQKTLHSVFDRNSAIPNQRQLTFTTHRDNQTDVVMRLFQGDQELPEANSPLGEFTFAGLRAGKAGSVRVEVVFDVSAEGILRLTAKDLDTGQAMQQTVHYR